MKLRAITLTNVRRFTGTVRIAPIGDGVNVLCEPNERGKSTLFDAIQTLFFVPHGSTKAKTLRPHSGGAPEVEIEVETGEGRFVIAKRWLSKATATVHSGGRLVAQADAAEAWIAGLLGNERGAGPSGLVWVRQGNGALTAGTTKEKAALLEARRDLLSSVNGEIEAMTGGRRMDAALKRCEADLGELATATGLPRTGGPWKAAKERLEALEQSRGALAETAAALHEALAARKRKRRELSELTDPQVTQDRRAQLETTRQAHEIAQRHAGEIEAAARLVEQARLAETTAAQRLADARAAEAEHREAAEAEAGARREAGTLLAARDAGATALAAAEAGLEIAHRALSEAQGRHIAARQRQAARDGAARRRDLEVRVRSAEAARRQMEEAEAQARCGVDSATLRKLEELSSAVGAAQAVRESQAPQIVMSYADGASGSVILAGRPLPEGMSIPLPEPVRLEIEGIGNLEVRPGGGADGAQDLESSRAALGKALADCGMPDLASARQAAEARSEAERRMGEARATLKGIAPVGIDALRRALAEIPALDETERTEDTPTLHEAEVELERAMDARVRALAERDAARERQSEVRVNAARAETSLGGAQARLARAAAALDRLGAHGPERLTADLAKAQDVRVAAQDALAERERDAPDLQSTKARYERAQSVENEARAAIARLGPEIATLDERIARSSGDAVEERLAETEQQVEAARRALGLIEREVKVLTRLKTALETARAASRDQYFEGVVAELRPLLHLLWPDAKLQWESETLLPSMLVRDGQEEPIDILSGGTQEQISLLVRLAFARMLARDGRHAPLILDDALVFTDDDRIERMFDALHRQAGGLQIIVLSCRQRAFRALGGKTLQLETPERTAAGAA